MIPISIPLYPGIDGRLAVGETEIPLSVALAKADGTGNIGSAGIVLSVLAMYLILTVFSFSIGAGALLDVQNFGLRFFGGLSRLLLQS